MEVNVMAFEKIDGDVFKIYDFSNEFFDSLKKKYYFEGNQVTVVTEVTKQIEKNPPIISSDKKSVEKKVVTISKDGYDGYSVTIFDRILEDVAKNPDSTEEEISYRTGLDFDSTISTLDKLAKQGEVFSPKSGKWRLM
jgi:predicted SPOUT superfamily RNA methylase MTH1